MKTKYIPKTIINKPKDGYYWAVRKVLALIQADCDEKFKHGECTSHAQNNEPIEAQSELVQVKNDKVYHTTYLISSDLRIGGNFFKNLKPELTESKMTEWWIVSGVNDPYQDIKDRVSKKSKEISDKINKGR